MNEFKTPMFQAMQVAGRVKEQQQAIDSRDIAEMMDKRHSDLVRDIDTHVKAMSQNANLRSDDYYIESSYQAGTGKSYRCYLLTKLGCEMIANKLTGEKGILFTAFYVKHFNQMEQAQQVSPEQSLAMLFRSQADLLEETQCIKNDVKFLKGEMRLSTSDEQMFSNLANQRVTKSLGGKKARAYKDASLRQTVYSQFWKEFKDYFEIARKGDLPRVKLQEAKMFIREWTPNTENRMTISKLNDQLELDFES